MKKFLAKPRATLKRTLLLKLILAFVLGGLPAVWAQDGGEKVQLPAVPHRIVTLAPSLGELAADLLGDDLERIVGVSEYTDYPPALKKVPSVGAFNHFNMEKVISLKPDLVLATTDGNSKEQIEQLRELKVPVLVVRTDDFEQIAESVLLVSKALGEVDSGKKMASRLKAGVENLRLKAKTRKNVRILLQIGEDPLVVVGGGTFLNQAIEAVGGENIFRDTRIHYPRPSMEEIMLRNPEVIVILIMGEGPSRAENQRQSWLKFPRLQAVKSQRVRVLHSDTLLRPTLRILEGLTLLERTIHGQK